jgi:hypothetical protein
VATTTAAAAFGVIKPHDQLKTVKCGSDATCSERNGSITLKKFFSASMRCTVFCKNRQKKIWKLEKGVSKYCRGLIKIVSTEGQILFQPAAQRLCWPHATPAEAQSAPKKKVKACNIEISNMKLACCCLIISISRPAEDADGKRGGLCEGAPFETFFETTEVVGRLETPLPVQM